MSVDPQYRKMMLWVLAAFITAIVAGILIVEWTMRRFAE
jgi:hypothetical protein